MPLRRTLHPLKRALQDLLNTHKFVYKLKRIAFMIKLKAAEYVPWKINQLFNLYLLAGKYPPLKVILFFHNTAEQIGAFCLNRCVQLSCEGYRTYQLV